jgi:hypothetical protein
MDSTGVQGTRLDVDASNTTQAEQGHDKAARNPDADPKHGGTTRRLRFVAITHLLASPHINQGIFGSHSHSVMPMCAFASFFSAETEQGEVMNHILHGTLHNTFPTAFNLIAKHCQAKCAYLNCVDVNGLSSLSLFNDPSPYLNHDHVNQHGFLIDHTMTGHRHGLVWKGGLDLTQGALQNQESKWQIRHTCALLQVWNCFSPGHNDDSFSSWSNFLQGSLSHRLGLSLKDTMRDGKFGWVQGWWSLFLWDFLALFATFGRPIEP